MGTWVLSFGMEAPLDIHLALEVGPVGMEDRSLTS